VGRGCPVPLGEGSGQGAVPLPRFFLFLVQNRPFLFNNYTVRHKKTHQNSFVYNFAKY